MYTLDKNLNIKRITNPPHIIEEFTDSKTNYSYFTISLAVVLVLVLVYLVYRCIKSN